MSIQVPLGECVPPNTRHGVSVSLPMWEDNVDYEKGDPRVLSRMNSGYPRFFIAKVIQALAERLRERFALPGEAIMLFPSGACAERCVAFIHAQALKHESIYGRPKPESVRIVEHTVAPISKKAAALDAMQAVLDGNVTIYCTMLPEALFPLAKQYWQHTGNGISARLAEYCLHIEQVNEKYELEASSYSRLGRSPSGYHRKVATGATAEPSAAETDLEADAYLEERFGRNLNAKYADDMKWALRRRIAGALSKEEQVQGAQVERDVADLNASDVFLTATGMSAVFYAHQALLHMRPAKSVCFGFPYTDTLKILEKFGPGAYFLGNGEGSDYERLEEILAEHSQQGQPILAIFTECPSNPLLKTADLPRLRALADRYGAALVVDETIGSFVNIDVLKWADMVVSSLTKVFSGDSNVMGGSIVLNPLCKLYAPLQTAMAATFEDLMWCEDAIFLERNSRDFVQRVLQINQNALAVAELLRSSTKVSKVSYPKYTTPENYQQIMRPNSKAGYGGLLSVVFVGGEAAARQFYDNLRCCKGPSLGTNFTLASPYTILAHFTELEWAAQYGVRADLVRISVGLEPQAELIAMFQAALEAIQVS
ncbi:Cystathionine gamma-synthase [Coemansia sp. RSA 2336]|nr:Cystathionine gamma-synthase [Coemansia sp. RSA 2336]